MRIIQPYDFSEITLDYLIENKKILPTNGNKVWSATIFPKSKQLNLLSFYDKNHIVTQISDDMFKDFVILNKTEETIFVNRGKGKKHIKAIEIGDFNDSIKRTIQLDKPIDYNENASVFLNLPKLDITLINQLELKKDLIFKPEVNINEFARTTKLDPFQSSINHPFITIPKQNNIILKNNNKRILEEIFKWAKFKGIKYIYCINEWRPYVINTDWTIPYIYYTIKGSY